MKKEIQNIFNQQYYGLQKNKVVVFLSSIITSNNVPISTSRATEISYNAKRWFEEHTPIFYIIFLVIWITPISSMIISPAIGAITGGIDGIVGGLFGMFAS